MSGLIVDLTGQTLVLLVILTGHFRIRTFYDIFHIAVASRVLPYNAVLISFFFGFFFLLCTKSFKEKKNAARIFMLSCRNETQQSETTTNSIGQKKL